MSARDDDWAKAKRLCRLSAEDVRKARALGLNPRKLIANIPSPSQRWKAPVRDWIGELYRKRFGEPPGAGAAAASHWERQIREEDRSLARRQQEFRVAADYVATALAQLPMVDRVVLFGSVARPLRREVPRFKKFRRAGVELLHECKDVDLAVWVSDTHHLELLRKSVSRAVNDLFAAEEIGVAHHQVDVFLLEPGSDRYLGRLCHFGTCPKGKPECAIPGCGARSFLRQHEGFVFDPRSLTAARSVVLFDRARASGPPQRARTDFEDRKAICEIAEDEKQQEAIRAVGLRNAGRCADEARRLSPLDPAGEEKARRAAEPPLLAKRPRRGADEGVNGQTP
ncbi:MAG: hypothetical protein QOH06_3600 [Acidobacteriota bacterium]|jgi:hypothetical protein|nr:hypothetical protein [Acidobacteriota bacterium]